jgi:hypothetical protein
MSIQDRDLQIANWGVTVNEVTDQYFAFTTEAGGGTEAKVIVRVYNECRKDASVNRTDVGYFFGGVGTAVAGIAATPDPISILAGAASSINITFVEGIAQNTLLYSESSAIAATVKMCVEIGLYDNDEANLVNFAEIELEYTIDLTEDFAALTGYTVTQAGDFNDPNVAAVTFDGTLGAYFCDKSSPTEALVAASGITIQGSEISVCFRVPDGQFEVKDIISLTVVDDGATQSQDIISNSVEQTGTAATPLAVTVLTDSTTADTNVVVVSFLLYATFFDTAALTLAGTGSVLLEFGGASGSRTRHLRKVDLRILQQQSATTEPFSIDEHEFVVEGGGPSSASSLASSVVVIGTSFLAAMVL